MQNLTVTRSWFWITTHRIGSIPEDHHGNNGGTTEERVAEVGIVCGERRVRQISLSMTGSKVHFCDNNRQFNDMCRRIIFLLIVGVGSGWGQQNGQATSFVADVATFARTGTSWKGEGSLLTKGTDGKVQLENFRIAYQLGSSIRARLEITNGSNPLLRVCDGSSQWTYYANTNSYVRVMLPKIGPCADPINAWPPLSINIPSPVFAGKDVVKFNGPREFTIVRGKNVLSVQNPTNLVTTLCVDPTTKLILRFQTEASFPIPLTRTYTFSSLERNVPLDASLFQFHPPDGSAQIAIINWLDPTVPATDSALRITDQMIIPQLTTIVAPVPRFPPPSLLHNSAVVMGAEVDGQGMVQNVKVNYSLGKDLDNDAIEAVKKWRFESATQDGKPVAVVVAIAVFFSGPALSK